MLLISSNTQYFRVVDTAYIKQNAVFSRGRYCLYQAIGSIFWGWILFILRTTQYFPGVDTAYTKQYAEFSGD